jgi:hypothetical protein
MKINEKTLSQLIDNLNNVICAEDLLTRDERQVLVQSVAALAGMKVRLESLTTEKMPPKAAKSESKERVIDPRFPHAGTPWNDEDDSLLHEIIDPLPDDEISHHVFWLSEKLGRTPYSVACKIVQIGRCSLKWRDPFKKITDELRESQMSHSEFLKSKNENRD